MTDSQFTISATDGTTLSGRIWRSSGAPRAIIQFIDGMASHSLRFGPMALLLSQQGFTCVCLDHRGQGLNKLAEEQPGYQGISDWKLLADDQYLVSHWLHENWSNLPIILYGHSMGSFVAQIVLTKMPSQYQGAIIQGTGYMGGKSRLQILLLRLISGLLMRLGFGKTVFPFFQKEAFRGYNRHIEDTRSRLDWLTRDSHRVADYIADPDCAYLCPVQFFYNLSLLILNASSPRVINQIRHNLPILFMTGSKDPVGGFEKKSRKQISIYKDLGFQDLTTVFIPEARHELHNEINAADICLTLCQWIEQGVLG